MVKMTTHVLFGHYCDVLIFAFTKANSLSIEKHYNVGHQVKNVQRTVTPF
jgi:hypothetical protein